MKRFIILLSLLLSAFLFAACGSNNENSGGSSSGGSSDRTTIPWDKSAKVCDKDNTNVNDFNSCKNSTGAMHYIGVYELVSIKVKNCGGEDKTFDATEKGANDTWIKGEIGTNPSLQAKVHIPIVHKLQFGKSSEIVTKCTEFASQLLYKGSIEHDVSANLNNLTTTFEEVGLFGISGDREKIIYKFIGADGKVQKIGGYEVELTLKKVVDGSLGGPLAREIKDEPYWTEEDPS